MGSRLLPPLPPRSPPRTVAPPWLAAAPGVRSRWTLGPGATRQHPVPARGESARPRRPGWDGGCGRGVGALGRGGATQPSPKCLCHQPEGPATRSSIHEPLRSGRGQPCGPGTRALDARGRPVKVAPCCPRHERLRESQCMAGGHTAQQRHCPEHFLGRQAVTPLLPHTLPQAAHPSPVSAPLRRQRKQVRPPDHGQAPPGPGPQPRSRKFCCASGVAPAATATLPTRRPMAGAAPGAETPPKGAVHRLLPWDPPPACAPRCRAALGSLGGLLPPPLTTAVPGPPGRDSRTHLSNKSPSRGQVRNPEGSTNACGLLARGGRCPVRGADRSSSPTPPPDEGCRWGAPESCGPEHPRLTP